MKALNDTAAAIMRSILQTGRNKIDNSGGRFLPLHIVVAEKHKDYKIVTLTHYREAEGELLCDPEMSFIFDMAAGRFIPYRYKNGFTGIETQSLLLENDKITILFEGLQEDHAVFANIWLLTIGRQQEIYKEQ